MVRFGMFPTESKYEWECPVCGHYENFHRMHIGDPVVCPNCGNFMEPKKYYSPFGVPRFELTM